MGDEERLADSGLMLSDVEWELVKLDMDRLDEWEACAASPARLMGHMKCFDERSRGGVRLQHGQAGR